MKEIQATLTANSMTTNPTLNQINDALDTLDNVTALYHAHQTLDLYAISRAPWGEVKFSRMESDINEDSPDALLCNFELSDFPEGAIIIR